MEQYNKQVIGYLLMAVVGAAAALGIYYIGKYTMDPALVAIFSFMIGAIETAAYKWIKYNFDIPLEEPEPEPPLVFPGPPSEAITSTLPEVD